MIVPSNTTVIRFIALYGHGLSFPVRHLILGHGYQEKGGRSHGQLLGIYEKENLSQNEKIYAGYLCMEDSRLKVFSGGSGTLGIPRNEELDMKLEHELETLQSFADATRAVYPLIISDTVQHLLIAWQ